MSANRDAGCDAKLSTPDKEIAEGLAMLFAPQVFFTADERFFPVDLDSTISASGLWLLDESAKPPAANPVKGLGGIDVRADLPAARINHFTSVAGVCGVLAAELGGAHNVVAPCVDFIADQYSSGALRGELTVYATICNAKDVPNSHLLKGAKLSRPELVEPLLEGLILCYYLYFPCMESTEIDSEGDWSGIALLLPKRPTNLAELSDPLAIERFAPVVAAYFRKTIDGSPPSPHFVAANGGFKFWKDITKSVDQATNVETHPHVYISRGRHNCLFSAGATTFPLSPPWAGKFTPDTIEAGTNNPGPAENKLTGGGIEDTPWWVYPAFPPFALLVMCATGCDHPMHFDTSGIAPGYQDGQDQTSDDGYRAAPGQTGSLYPSQPANPGQPGSQAVGLRVQFIDLNDPVTEALWGYQGAWGAATLHHYPMPQGKPAVYWGHHRGSRRPALAAWFLWNLFIDAAYGAAGVPPSASSRWP